MNSVEIKLSNRKYFTYAFPKLADSNGNFDIDILTGLDFYLTSFSFLGDTSASPGVILLNISTEKYTGNIDVPLTLPVNAGFNGSPYFLPVPWRLKNGTKLRALGLGTISGVTAPAELAISGYRQ